MPRRVERVFINVPFDRRYQKLLDALVFAVHACGLRARCATDIDDGSVVRIEKLYKLIEGSRFGIHDLSRTSLDTANRLPRFNMPLELGLFLGAKRFGSTAQRRKSCLILDVERYRFAKFCSDIAGQDIRAHRNDTTSAIAAVRNWLQSQLGAALPGPAAIGRRYLRFRTELPAMCGTQNLAVSDLTFIDYRNLVEAWLQENAA